MRENTLKIRNEARLNQVLVRIESRNGPNPTLEKLQKSYQLNSRKELVFSTKLISSNIKNILKTFEISIY